MKIRIIIFILIVILLFPYSVFAVDLCKKKGYTISAINGIFTDEEGARNNQRMLKVLLKDEYNGEKLDYQYLLNQTHLLGIGDAINAVQQGLFDQKSDYDLTEMLNDASRKVTTQKLLLVAHSQGNFYANNFYNKVASKEGGVPSQSIGVYGVATPANYVAGGGKYLTSDTDKVISATVARFIKILTPNIHIPLQKSDGNGHSFSDVYLKYQGDRIISDIKSSLNQLKENDEQEPQDICISPPELTALHKIKGVALASADFLVNNTKNAVVYAGNGIYNAGLATKNMFKRLVANVVDSLPNTNSVTTILPSISESSNTNTETTPPNTNEQTQTITEDTTTNETKNNEIPTTVVETPSAVNVESAEELPPQTPQVPEIIPDVSHGGGGDNGDPPIEDKTAPVISVVGTNPIDVTKGTLYTDAGATALDEKDGIVEVVMTGSVDTSIVGVYTITYTATDLAKNTSTATRTVNVVEEIIPDKTAPIISVVGTNPINITQNNIYTDEGATALDDIDGARDVVTSGTVDTATIGTYTITYTATDISKNTATATRIVNVVAPPPPPDVDTIIDKNTTLASGEYNYDNLIITNNAILTLEGNPESANAFKGVKITAKNITINNGSRISADSKGYKNRTGPGAPDVSHPGGGASYGGVGHGNASTSVYGSATMPLELGTAGGGPNSVAGGAIRLAVTKTLTNNGIISVNGDVSSSGGSIYVTAKEITGSGTFSANGGNLYAGGYFAGPGGGGRIAFYYETNSFTGKIEALGGCGSYDGMTRTCAKDGTIGLFDTLNNDIYLNSSWQFRESDGPFSFNKIFVSNGAKVTSEKSVSINADEILIDKASQITLAEDQILNIPIISLDNSTLTLSGSETITSDVLTLSGNSTVTIGEEKILSLEIPNITVGLSSSISANSKGYVDGPGAPLASNYYAGASYGGVGGSNTKTSVYGSDTEPIDFGSGGTNIYRGGGAIRLIISDTLTNNGTISANGDVTSSGGSLYINTKNILGNGNFYANGGGAYCGGSCYQPGGGGRVAIYYEAYSFTGKVLADGWSGSIGTSSAGTVKKIDTTLSTSKAITAFDFTGLTPPVNGVINETEKTVSLTVPFGTVVSALVPTITISEKATISPNTNIAQNFSNPVTYIVTAENGITQNYIVTVTVAPDPGPDNTIPDITSYTFEEVASDVIFNPLVKALSIVFIANKNINWVSVKIEKQDDATIYKYFYPGADCDGKNTCAQDWDGLLAGDSIAPNGVYKVKVRLRDLISKEEYDFLSPYLITLNRN